jgi:hypothetical protein
LGRRAFFDFAILISVLMVQKEDSNGFLKKEKTPTHVNQ